MSVQKKEKKCEKEKKNVQKKEKKNMWKKNIEHKIKDSLIEGEPPPLLTKYPLISSGLTFLCCA